MDHSLVYPQTPEALLGPDHPLARANGALAAVRRQAGAVALLLVGSVAALVFGVGQALTLVIGAAIVLPVLGVVAGELWDRRRHAARQLVLDGRETLPLAPIQRERRRLLEARTRR